MVLYIVLGVAALIAVFAVVMYNGFVKMNNTVKEAFATMDVYLTKRWDLVPNLVETVKGYAKHEEETLAGIVELRNSSYDKMSANEKVDVNNKLNACLSKLMAIAETYPDLKANQNFQALQADLSKIEDEIANARKYYNGAVKMMNDKVEIFPNNIFAKIFGFKKQEMFSAEEEKRENVKVEF